MKTRKPKESSVLIRIPAELARDIFRESGDLQFSKFPATMTLVESIGKALNFGREERKKQLKPVVFFGTRKPVVTHKRTHEYPLFTR